MNNFIIEERFNRMETDCYCGRIAKLGYCDGLVNHFPGVQILVRPLNAYPSRKAIGL